MSQASLHPRAGVPLGRADYGIDAPGLQRGALYGGFAAVVAGRFLHGYGAGQHVSWAVGFANALVWSGVSFFVTGALMYWGSKVGKLRLRDRILDSIAWRGDERVLDVGCGHGLLLLGAAKRLPAGRATGVDLWSQVDQAANSAEATEENARREGVADRVEICDGDARQLPFADNSFDVILSSFVIHNISGAAERQKAICEMARVLKPGGQLAIADIHHTVEYTRVLGELGWKNVNRWPPNFLFVTPTRVIRAAKP